MILIAHAAQGNEDSGRNAGHERSELQVRVRGLSGESGAGGPVAYLSGIEPGSAVGWLVGLCSPESGGEKSKTTLVSIGVNCRERTSADGGEQKFENNLSTRRHNRSLRKVGITIAVVLRQQPRVMDVECSHCCI